MTGHVIKLITFDAYLTLFKPTGSVSLQYAEEAVKLGLQVTKASISQHFSIVFRNHLKQAPLYGRNSGMTTRTWWEKMIYETFITAGVKKQDLDPVYEKLFDILWIRFATAEGYTIFPEVHNTLTQLKQHGYQMGVISNSDDTLESILKDLELVQYFDFIVPSCFVGHEKPDSRIYERALELAGNIHPNETLHIGDDIEKDFHGARNAGLHSTLIKRDPNDATSEYELGKATSAETTANNISFIPESISCLSELCTVLAQKSTATQTTDLPDTTSSTVGVVA